MLNICMYSVFAYINALIMYMLPPAVVLVFAVN